MRLFRMFYVGKSQKLFPTFFIVLSIAATAFAGQWPDLFYNLLGFPQVDLDLSAESHLSSGYLSVSTGYNDVYRKKIDGQTTLTFAEQGNELRFGLPFRTGKMRHYLTGDLAENFVYFNNLKDETGLVSRCRIETTNLSVRWIVSYDGILFGLGTNFNQNVTPLAITVMSFPQSADSRTNKYFFNLLEPTFGRELTNKLQTRNSGIRMWVAHRLTKYSRIAIGTKYSDLDANWRMRYINSGSKAALAGQRQIDIPVNGAQKHIFLSVFSTKSVLQNLSIIHFDDQFAYYIDNNPPATTDFDSLGSGNLGRYGNTLSARVKLKTWEITGGLSITNYDLDAFLRTPVLGYYLFWPISHSAEVNFTRGQSFGQQIGIDKTFYFGNFNIRAGSAYAHTLYDFWLEGTAELMLGIESTPLDYPFKYSLHVLDLHAEMAWHKGPFGLTYTFRQLLPSGRRLDDSPIQFTTKTSGVDYTNRGGQQHQIDLAYIF